MLNEGGASSLWRGSIGFIFPNNFEIIIKQIKKKNFFKGNGINCLKIAPEAALKFMFYEEVCNYYPVFR